MECTENLYQKTLSKKYTPQTSLSSIRILMYTQKCIGIFAGATFIYFI